MGLKAGRILRAVAANARMLLAATVVTIVLMIAASAALYVTSAPEWLSLLLEPFSLLLLPGLVVAFATSGSHDFPPNLVIAVSAAVYLVLIYAVLLWRALARRSGEQLRAGSSR